MSASLSRAVDGFAQQIGRRGAPLPHDGCESGIRHEPLHEGHDVVQHHVGCNGGPTNASDERGVVQQCLQLVVDPVDKVDEIRKARIDRALVEFEELVPPQSQTRVGSD